MKFNEFLQEINEIPIIDVHTHIDTSHYTARGLDDILLYHMLITELYSSGCPSGGRLDEYVEEDERIRRLEEAVPYLENIENTNTFFCAKIIFKDLYDWDKPITKDNWRELDEIIRKKYIEKKWADEIIKKAGISTFSTELSRKGKQNRKDVIFSLEWSFFTRAQWKQFDTALIELEFAWMHDKPSKPLSVNFDPALAADFKRIKTLKDVDDAITHYVDKIPTAEVVSSTQHFSTDIEYRYVSDEEMEKALKNRDNCGEYERDVYANYIVEKFMTKIEEKKINFLYQFSLGAEPLPFETGSKIRSQTIFQLAELFNKHPSIKFQVFMASESNNHALCTIARETPNLSLAGYWWHNFFPGQIRKLIDTRLDMLPVNKQVGFFSDAYCMDWAYAKSKLVRQLLAEALYDRINSGRYTHSQALTIARKMFYDTPKSLLNI